MVPDITLVTVRVTPDIPPLNFVVVPLTGKLDGGTTLVLTVELRLLR